MRIIIYIFIAFLIFPFTALAQQEVALTGEDIEKYATKKIAEYLNENYPFLELKHTTPSDSNDSSGYAIGYDWSEERQGLKYNNSNPANIVTHSYRAKAFAKGSHVIGDSANTQNLSEAGISIGIKRSSLGALKKKLLKTQSAEFQACMNELDENDAAYEQQEDQCAVTYGAWDMYQTNRANQWVYGVDALAIIEADDGYSQKQMVYGVELSATLSPHQDSFLAKANFLDLPFFIIRKAFSQDDSYRPHWPLIRLGVQTVDVKDNDAREAVLPDEDSFERAYGEIAFNTVVAKIKESSVKFNASYEMYQEINPKNEIENAGLDDFNFFSASMQVPAALVTDLIPEQTSFFVRYTEGELPFDRKSTKAFEIGWRTNLNLKGLISKPSNKSK